jgi:GNAT superfamily N-acetyltransferase
MPTTGRAISIRLARARDLAVLCRLWQELMHFHEGQDPRFALAVDALEQWRAQADEVMRRDDGFVLLAEDDGRPVGFCLGWVAKNPPIYRVSEVGFVSEIAVTSTHQRRGVGRALIEAATDWFVRRGLKEFQLSTAVWNDEAHAFWKALGGEPLLTRYRFDLQGVRQILGGASDDGAS